MLKKIIAVMAILTPFIAFSSSALAIPASSLEQSQLSSLVKSFNAASQRKDVSLMVNTMPERVLKEMAKRMDKPESELKHQMHTAINTQFNQLSAGAYQLDPNKIEYKETSDGHFYALVPTKIETDKAVTEFMTLAIYDNTKWHFIYGGSKAVHSAVFSEIYPYAEEIKLPAAKVTKK